MLSEFSSSKGQTLMLVLMLASPNPVSASVGRVLNAILFNNELR